MVVSKQAIAGKKAAVSLPFKKRFIALNCEKCAKMFKTISSLNYHTKTFHSDKKFKCSTCKPVKRFKYLKNLEAHVNESHQRESSAVERKPIGPFEKKTERKRKQQLSKLIQAKLLLNFLKSQFYHFAYFIEFFNIFSFRLWEMQLEIFS